MKTQQFFAVLGLAGLLLAAPACSDDVLDDIDTNPNRPETASLRLLLPQVETDAAFGISGTELAWYSSVFVEHTTGVHAQFEQIDKRAPGAFVSNVTNNNWSNIYATNLKDVDTIIRQGSIGSEAGSWRYVGIAKILKAYVLGIATDLFGRVPNTNALQGASNLKPTFDTQESVYASMQTLLDEAILDLDKPSAATPGNTDFFFNGDPAQWKKVAYSLKARYANRLSKRDAAGSATRALAAAAQGFTAPTEGWIFTRFTTASIGENPWYQERNDRSHLAVSTTIYDLFTTLNDPRGGLLVDTIPGGTRVAAPNGTALTDQGSVLYSRASPQLVNATAPLPLMTYAELKFIEAEANLRLGNRTAAYTAYQAAVAAALAQQLVPPAAATAYLAQVSVSPGAAGLTLSNIITQKYLSFFVYQPIEAYNDYRRTGIPALHNPEGAPPRRFPYPQNELDNNRLNVPATSPGSGVWWDDGTED
ncbi:SusD/RagB family nutrient-binding outer membrane lipoprotein [Hymenobacter lucidus]|uniref:SusD/RagB family nutrient-binding outer membrane lipoprotein n=1 Tax=Hymenobacter lucidus TaxID=2880930 RepID=A0ABS8APB1_9BACT|nr:SusD/RagB family nutrient-binding outer membrane lipoprotein [Hymenobacter lucidus]MCB2408038.1 SusD/RagB family nutrient-binding outer membrane lipoprotein [Hymenobacter lucidus]